MTTLRKLYRLLFERRMVRVSHDLHRPIPQPRVSAGSMMGA